MHILAIVSFNTTIMIYGHKKNIYVKTEIKSSPHKILHSEKC